MSAALPSVDLCRQIFEATLTSDLGLEDVHVSVPHVVLGAAVTRGRGVVGRTCVTVKTKRKMNKNKNKK